MLEKEISTKEWLPIDCILEDGAIITKEKNYIKILKIIPINFNLKTELEKNSVLKSYKEFLKICNFDIQIIIQSNKENLSKIISRINQNKKEKNMKMQLVAQEYIKFLENINLKKKSASKDYYIVIKEKIDENNEKIIKENINEKCIKIKEALSKCGNKTINLNKKEIVNILFSFFNRRIYYIKN